MSVKRGWTKRAAAWLLSVGLAVAAVPALPAGCLDVRAEESGGSGRAVVVYLDSPSLQGAPEKDAAALKTILGSTNEFEESAVEVYKLPEDSSEDGKTALWNRVDAIAEETDEDSYTVFSYVGHGNQEKDGTSYLAAGGVNNITAAELRTHLDKLKGKVLVLLSCCYAGGMILPASEGEDTEGTEAVVTEEFGEDFLEAFESAETSAAGNAQPQYYFITTSNQLETGYSQSAIGTETIAAFGHALGYDRNNGSYHAFAADTTTLPGTESRSGYTGDGRITMKELADYYKKTNVITSSPTVYPEESSEVLFTYTEEAGTPASLSCSIPQENVSVDKDGVIKFTATVQNLTDHDIQVGTGVYDLGSRTFALTTASHGKYPNGESLDGYIEADGTYTVKAGSTDTVKYELIWDEFRDGTSNEKENPFSLKIWDCTGTGDQIGTYRLLSFYTRQEETLPDTIDPDALSFRKPVQLTANEGKSSAEGTDAGEEEAVPDAVTKTSSRLPVEIVYDTQTQSKYTNAACTLSLYAYDLGTQLPDGIHAEKDAEGASDVLKNAGGEEISLSDEARQTVFENVRPTHDRIGDEDLRGSIHTYVWDTSELSLQHYYALRAVCHEDATGKERSVYALILRTEAKEAEQYQIPFVEFSDDTWDWFRSRDGFTVGESWNVFKEEYLTVEGVGKELQEALNRSSTGLYSFFVTGWDVRDESGEWRSVTETEKFKAGGTYRCVIEVKVEDGYNAVFTKETKVRADRHELGRVAVINSRTLDLEVIHRVPDESSLQGMTLEMYRADAVNERIAEDSGSLHPGDKVILVAGEDCCFNIREGLERTKESVKKDGVWYDVYQVSDFQEGTNSAELRVRVWKKSDDNCGCTEVLYRWTAHLNPEGGNDGGKVHPDDGAAGGAAAKEESAPGSTSAAGSGAAGAAESADGQESAGLSAVSAEGSELVQNAAAAGERSADDPASRAAAVTGDDARPALWLLLGLSSAACGRIAVTRRKKRKQ